MKVNPYTIAKRSNEVVFKRRTNIYGTTLEMKDLSFISSGIEERFPR